MRLEGKVVRVESGESYLDKLQRVTIRVKTGGTSTDILTVINRQGWKVDEPVYLEILSTAVTVGHTVPLGQPEGVIRG